MTEALVVSIMIEAMRMATLLSAPMLIGALVVGLLVSIFQAVTQIQEPNFSNHPKDGGNDGCIGYPVPMATHPGYYLHGRDFFQPPQIHWWLKAFQIIPLYIHF